MDDEFVELDLDEVITLETLQYADMVLKSPTFRVSECTKTLEQVLGNALGPNWGNNGKLTLKALWLQNGIDCERLKPGLNEWQKGRVRIKVSLEFCPDEPEIEEELVSEQVEIEEPESPLDDLRRMINEKS